MDRARRIADLWAWLPAFRTVAETQHLPSAGRMLGVSPSALSRSVSLLEDAIGQTLFERRGRRLELNPRGEQLLVAVREAMRRVDDALSFESRSARVRIAGQAAWVNLLVIPVADAVEIDDVSVESIRPALMRGEIDLAITDGAVASDGIVIEKLGNVARALCARRGKPVLHAVCTDGPDPWPAERARTVVVRSPRLDVVATACTEREVAAVLPLPIAREHALRAIRDPVIATSQLYLVRRAPLAPSALDAVVAAIRRRATRVLG